MKRLRSVLCVDDDDDICTVLQATLCLIAGLDVCTVRNGEEMINIAREWRPDLILMDIMMPGLDGPSTVNRMRANPMLANTPVIFLTAKVMPSELAHLLKLGVLGVIAKPFDPMKLGEQVFALWDGAQSATVVASMPPAAATETASTLAHREIESVAERFLERAQQDVEILRQSFGRAKRGDVAALEHVEYIGHSISGAGAMLGYLNMSVLGERIERLAGAILKSRAAHDSPVDLASLRQLKGFIERLAQEVRNVPRVPPTDTVLGQLSRAPGSCGVNASSSRYPRAAVRGRKPCLD
jgi:CheY-like chemotaxis protein